MGIFHSKQNNWIFLSLKITFEPSRWSNCEKENPNIFNQLYPDEFEEEFPEQMFPHCDAKFDKKKWIKPKVKQSKNKLGWALSKGIQGQT